MRTIFFFFSSRRRHTRFDCDWSSDVCSSDLVELAGTFVQRKKRLPPPAAQTNPNAPAPFVYQPAGYGVLDLMAHWNFAPGATFNVGVFNLADKRYIE